MIKQKVSRIVILKSAVLLNAIFLALIHSTFSKTTPSVYKQISQNPRRSSKPEKNYADFDDIPYDNCNGTSLKSYKVICLLGAGWFGAGLKVHKIGTETRGHTFALKVQEQNRMKHFTM